MSIGIIGAGAFGTALAVALSANDDILLWGRNADQIEAIQQTGRNERYLPGLDLPNRIGATAQLDDLAKVDVILLALPAQQTARFLSEHELPATPLVLCAKGIDAKTHRLQSELATTAPDGLAVLTGPGFAVELARGLPTALTLACEDTGLGARLQKMLSTPRLRLYLTTDITGAQLGGAMKNVVAIACGIAVGAGLGESAKAALMTRGFTEMQRLGVAMGAQRETFAGLSGLGDLALTCGSEMSRNFAAGLAVGKGGGVQPGVTVEGAPTAGAACALATEHGVEMPIAATVAAVLDGKLNVAQAMEALLSRPLKEES